MTCKRDQYLEMKTRFAIIDGARRKPEPNLRGKCQCCEQIMIAKCGDIKAWHWAHKSKKSCDPWWENETEWHRSWKNMFPVEWQEVVHKDPLTGEKHIADVKTDTGMFIEFQNSPIKIAEQLAREKFYQDMVWVVNGARRKTDYPRFRKGLKECRPTNQNGIFSVNFPDELFPKAWFDRPVPVFFDFHGAEGSHPTIDAEAMWCILPKRLDRPLRPRILAIINKSDLIKYSTSPDDQGNLFEKLKIINSGQ